MSHESGCRILLLSSTEQFEALYSNYKEEGNWWRYIDIIEIVCATFMVIDFYGHRINDIDETRWKIFQKKQNGTEHKVSDGNTPTV